MKELHYFNLKINILLKYCLMKQLQNTVPGLVAEEKTHSIRIQIWDLV